MNRSGTHSSPTACTTAGSRAALETSSWVSVVRAYEECDQRFAQLLAEFDLSISQYDALAAIDALGTEAQPKAVAERLLVTRANVTGLLRRLEARSLIRVASHHTDGRSVLCEIAPKGRALLDRANTASAHFIQEQLKPFQADELALIRNMMKRLHDHLLTLNPVAIAAQSSTGPRN
ncbi:MAG: MarR family transcriptional regulator [Pseudomonadota bacterium]